MLGLRKSAKFIIPVLLVSIICFFSNLALNQHFHKLSSGEVVKHAHPFKKGNAGNPFQEHNHTAAEMVMLEQISNNFINIHSAIKMPAPPWTAIEDLKPQLIASIRNSEHSLLNNYRAPPPTS